MPGVRSEDECGPPSPSVLLGQPPLRTLMIRRARCQGFSFVAVPRFVLRPTRTGVVGVEVEHLLESSSGQALRSEAEMSQPLEIAALCPVAAREIVLEQQERRQGGGEEVDPNPGLSLTLGGSA